MAQDNLIYPVGLFYVGPGNVAPNVQVGNANTVGSSENSGVDQPSILPGNYETHTKATGSSDNENNGEDRNSESYWEKRKRFTLAFAAGLRQFIQLHPELLRYGPKKNQGGISATVTSTGVSGEDDETTKNGEIARCGRCVPCLKTDDCGKCTFCLVQHDMSKFGGKNELKKLCIRRHCLHAPVNKNTTSTITNAKSDSSSPSMSMTPDDSMEGPPTKINKNKSVGNDAEVLIPIKTEIPDEDEDDEDETTEEIKPKRSRPAAPTRAQRTRKPSRKARNDDDEDYVPSQRKRRTKQNQAVDSLLKGIRIKIEPLDVSE